MSRRECRPLRNHRRRCRLSSAFPTSLDSEFRLRRRRPKLRAEACQASAAKHHRRCHRHVKKTRRNCSRIGPRRPLLHRPSSRRRHLIHRHPSSRQCRPTDPRRRQQSSRHHQSRPIDRRSRRWIHRSTRSLPTDRCCRLKSHQKHRMNPSCHRFVRRKTHRFVRQKTKVSSESWLRHPTNRRRKACSIRPMSLRSNLSCRRSACSTSFRQNCRSCLTTRMNPKSRKSLMNRPRDLACWAKACSTTAAAARSRP
jgi:hypothetical protein